MRLPVTALLALFALSAPRSAHAQSPDPRLGLQPGRIYAVAALPPAGSAAPLSAQGAGGRVPAAWLAAAGVAGGGLGFVGGLLLGAVVDGPADEDCIDFCVGGGLIFGALAGEALGIAAGVHLANGRNGAFPVGALTSAGILALGLLAVQDSPSLVLLVPAGQIYGAIVAERSTEPRR